VDLSDAAMDFESGVRAIDRRHWSIQTAGICCADGGAQRESSCALAEAATQFGGMNDTCGREEVRPRTANHSSGNAAALKPMLERCPQYNHPIIEQFIHQCALKWRTVSYCFVPQSLAWHRRLRPNPRSSSVTAMSVQRPRAQSWPEPFMRSTNRDGEDMST
jgi:hypothetical protein